MGDAFSVPFILSCFRTSMAWQCKLNLLWCKTGRFADQPHLHSMKVLLPWYNHPFRFDQLYGPIWTVLLLKIKTYFEITCAFQKMALVAEFLVCDISDYRDVSIPPFALLQNTAFNSSVLSSQIASTQFTWPASEVILSKNRCTLLRPRFVLTLNVVWQLWRILR